MRANYLQTAVIPVQRLAKGNIARGIIDLRTCPAVATFQIAAILRMIKTGVTAIGLALTLGGIRRLDINAGLGGASFFTSLGAGTTTVPTGNSTVSVDALAGSYTITVASGTGFAANDIIGIYDGDNVGLARVETHKVLSVAGNVISLYAPLAFDHLASAADNVRNKVDIVTVSGASVLAGSINDIIMDYSAAATGDPQIISAQIVAIDS